MLLGFVLGSAAAITFALVGVAVVFGVLGPKYPELREELPSLWTSLGMFTVLTGAAAVSFYAQLREKSWRRAAVVAVLASLAVIGWFHWPR